jgi:ubiquitin-like-conjugating enzyme ATG3
MEAALRIFKDTREYLTPVLQASVFLHKGMLTPEEFLVAGDQLVRTCPSWRWEAGDPSKLRAYLPPNKQYLTTSGVPCYQRVSSLNSTELVEDVEKGDDNAGKEDNFVDLGAEASISDEWANVKDYAKHDSSTQPTNSSSSASAEVEEEYLDMEEEGLALDEASTQQTNVVRARRYDVSITYDNYYRTPRIWLYGYAENGAPLRTEAVFEVSNIAIKPHIL